MVSTSVMSNAISIYYGFKIFVVAILNIFQIAFFQKLVNQLENMDIQSKYDMLNESWPEEYLRGTLRVKRGKKAKCLITAHLSLGFHQCSLVPKERAVRLLSWNSFYVCCIHNAKHCSFLNDHLVLFLFFFFFSFEQIHIIFGLCQFRFCRHVLLPMSGFYLIYLIFILSGNLKRLL